MRGNLTVSKGSVDGRHDQWCVDNRHWPETRASLCDNPIRVKGRFGCSDSPVRDADWSDGHSVGVSPVGDVRIEYIGDAFSQGQSIDAAPLTELIDFYTLRPTVIVLQDLLQFGLSVLRFGITLVVKNLHDVVVIIQCVRQWMVRR